MSVISGKERRLSGASQKVTSWCTFMMIITMKKMVVVVVVVVAE